MGGNRLRVIPLKPSFIHKALTRNGDRMRAIRLTESLIIPWYDKEFRGLEVKNIYEQGDSVVIETDKGKKVIGVEDLE